MKETSLVRAIEQQIKYNKHIFAWRQNTGGATYKNKYGKQSFVKFGFAGISDIIGMRTTDGKFIAIECKVGNNKMTDKQCLFALEILNSGGIFIEARNVDDWLEVLDENYDPTKWVNYVKSQLPKGFIY